MKQYVAFLVPKFNLPVRDPITKQIMLSTGELKTLSGKEGRYWRRRIKEGCVEIKNINEPIKFKNKKSDKGE